MGERAVHPGRLQAGRPERKTGRHPRGITPTPRIRLDRATSARLAQAVQLTGIPTAELIDTALRQLLSGSALDALAHSGGGYPQPRPDRGALTRIGWQAEGIPAVPTVADLLPQDVLAKFHAVWMATGANVLYTAALSMLCTLEDRGTKAAALVADTLEEEIINRVDGLRARWEGGPSK